MSRFAPIVVFAYRRPNHLRRTLTSLMQCDGFSDSPVIVYRDGPRDAKEAAAVAATGDMAKALLGDRAEYHFSETNQGLARSVIAGVTDVISRYGRVIVIEDDLELAPSFLTFMNQALDRYAEDGRVFQISGYMFDVPELRASTTAVFLPFTVSWGWATWKRAWDQFEPEARGWEALKEDRRLRRRFNLDGAYDYATMLFRQMAGLRDSWAIRWYWTVFKENGLVLFPPRTLVRNTGFDGSGTHGRGSMRRFAAGAPTSYEPVRISFPDTVEKTALNAAVLKALRRQNGGFLSSIVDRMRRLIKF